MLVQHLRAYDVTDIKLKIVAQVDDDVLITLKEALDESSD